MPKSSSAKPAPRSLSRCSIWAACSGFSMSNDSVNSSLSVPRAGAERARTVRKSWMRSVRSSCRDETLTLADGDVVFLYTFPVLGEEAVAAAPAHEDVAVGQDLHVALGICDGHAREQLRDAPPPRGGGGSEVHCRAYASMRVRNLNKLDRLRRPPLR